MLKYHLELAWRGMRRFPRNSVLAALTAAVGLAACMTTLTLLHVLSADPLPGRDQHLYLAWIDSVQARHAGYASLNGVQAVNPWMVKPDAAAAVLGARRAVRQTAVADLDLTVTDADGRHAQKDQSILATTADFMPMFGVPLRRGRPWTAAEDAGRARVAMIDEALAQRLFGAADPVGRMVRLGGALFRVVGVVGRFAPSPHFYGLQSWVFDASRHESVFVPYTAAQDAHLPVAASGACDDAGGKGFKAPGEPDAVHCAWLQLWVQLDTPAQRVAYRSFLTHLSAQWPRSDAFGPPAPIRLSSAAQWLVEQQVVPDTVSLNVWLALSFQLLCMLNVAGLLTAKFLRGGAETGIRRALGAPRRSIFAQYVLEACGTCLAGGLLALPLTLGGLWILRQQAQDYAGLARLDVAMFVLLFALALAIGVLVGVVPAWRASGVEPGLQVKSP